MIIKNRLSPKAYRKKSSKNGYIKNGGEIVKYDVIVVGAGAAGLSSAAYLSKAGLKVLLCEKEERIGGLLKRIHFRWRNKGA